MNITAMQDSQTFPHITETKPGEMLPETESHLSTADNNDDSDLEITAQVLSAIRKRLFPGNNDIDNTQLLTQGFQNGRKYANMDSAKDAPFSDIAGQKYQCKYSLSSNLSSNLSSVPSHQSYSSEHFPTESEISVHVDQDLISASSDNQRSPDSTFTSSPLLQRSKEECIDGYSDFPSESDYSHGYGSYMPEGVVPSLVVQKERTQIKASHMLPPCRVCCDKASGFHYGANTCEACKGFFRRSLKKDTIEYKCSGNNQCQIQKGRRNNCPLCRYNKCLAIGMSKTAIKTGRYTHEKRTKDIVEVKQLSGDYVPLTSQSRRESDTNAAAGQPAMSGEDEKLLVRIYTAHKLLFPFWHSIQETGKLQANMQSYAERYVEKKSLLSIGNDFRNQMEANTVTKKMDEDIGNPSSTIQLLTAHLELAITVFVKFAKAIPGFCDLTLSDQAALVKLSRFEVWMIGAHKFFNYELEVVSGPRGNSYHREELCDVMDCGFVRAMFAFSKTLQTIQLSHEETALLKCLVLMFSDRSTLLEPEKVDEIQLRLMSCLQSLVNNVRKFSQIMNALVSLRDLTEWHNQIAESLVLEWPTIKRNPLLLEIMSV